MIYEVQMINQLLKKGNHSKNLLIIALLSQKLLKFTKENGGLQKNMEKAESNFLMGILIKEITSKVFFMEKVLTLGAMVLSIKEHSKMGSNMAKEFGLFMMKSNNKIK